MTVHTEDVIGLCVLENLILDRRSTPLCERNVFAMDTLTELSDGLSVRTGGTVVYN